MKSKLWPLFMPLEGLPHSNVFLFVYIVCFSRLQTIRSCIFSGKNYTNPTEEKFRLKIYMENKAKIAKHNQKASRGEKSYFLKMNHFGDQVSHYLNLFLCLFQDFQFSGTRYWNFEFWLLKSKYFVYWKFRAC